MADTTTVEQTEETPVAASPDQVGFEARMRDAGLDPAALDPDELKEAVEFHRANKGKSLRDAAEFDAALREKVREIVERPDAREMFKKHFGFIDPNETDADADDPVAQRIKKLETATAAMASALTNISQETTAQRSRETARAGAERLLEGLSAAVRSVPGADEHPRLNKLFQAAIAEGELSRDATPTQIKRWVQQEATLFNASVDKRATKRTAVPRPAEAGATLTKLKPAKPGASIADQLAEALGLPD